MSYGSEIRFYLRVAWRRLPFFAVPLLAVLIGGLAVVYYLPKYYLSSAKILVESQQIPDMFVKSTVTALASERLQVIQQRVTTRDNLLRIVDKFKLFGNKKGLSKTDIVEAMQQRVTFKMLDAGTSTRRRREDSLTVAFEVGFEYENPSIAAKVANEFVTLVLNEDKENRASRATETTAFLSREVDRLSGELKAIDEKIAAFKLSNNSTLPEKLAFNMSLLEKQQRMINDVERDIRSSQEQKKLLQFEASMRGSQASVTTASSGGMPSLEQQLQVLQAAYTQRSPLYSENHPEMRTLRKQIEATRKILDEQRKAAAEARPVDVNDPNLSLDAKLLAQKIAALDSSMELLTKQRDSLTTSTAQLDDIITRTPQVGADLGALERKRQAVQASSDDMSIKLSQAKLGERLEENQQAERFEVIEAPIVPQEPSRPKKLPLMALVVGASLAAGSAMALGIEFLDSTIKRSSDLTGKLSQRVLVVVPYISTTGERRRRRFIALFTILGLTLGIALLLALIHIFYMPLDFLMLRAMTSLRQLLG